MSLLDDISFAVGASIVFPNVDADGLAFDRTGWGAPVSDSNDAIGAEFDSGEVTSGKALPFSRQESPLR
ncbi:MAG: hypothetical protein OSB05_01215 [Akkermansiaceae bacterium]|nr:hypothetical protein [Akkermansiaceae bacterium]